MILRLMERQNLETPNQSRRLLWLSVPLKSARRAHRVVISKMSKGYKGGCLKWH